MIDKIHLDILRLRNNRNNKRNKKPQKSLLHKRKQRKLLWSQS